MRILRSLTLGYVFVLVLALASSLVAIWRYLEEVGATLAKVHDELAQVQRATEPLSEPLQGLRDIVAGTTEDLGQARDAFVKADRHLTSIAEQRGIAQPAR